MGAKGASECPSGYKPIRSLSRCNEARNVLLISKWKAEKSNTSPGRLPYCWVGRGGRANYNSNGDIGSDPSKTSEGRLICEEKGK